MEGFVVDAGEVLPKLKIVDWKMKHRWNANFRDAIVEDAWVIRCAENASMNLERNNYIIRLLIT